MNERVLPIIPALLAACSLLAGCGIAITPTQKLEQQAKAAVSRTMKDPSSAEFRSLDIYSGSGVVCGEVNAKNSFGAMAGFEGFVYDNGKVWLSSADGIEFSRARLRCADASLDEIDPDGKIKRATERSKAELEKIMATIPEGKEKDDLRKRIAEIDSASRAAAE